MSARRSRRAVAVMSVLVACSAGVGVADSDLNDPSILEGKPTRLSDADRAQMDAASKKVKALRAALDAPAERLARLRSATKFVGQSDAEAVATLKDTHSSLLANPVWEPLRLRAGEKLTGFVGDHGARIEEADGHPAIVESSAPLRSDVGDGQQKLTDLSLARTGDAFRPRNPAIKTVLPLRIADPLVLGSDGGMSLALNGDPNATASEVDGRLVYPNAATDTDVVLEPAPGGVELSVAVRSRSAPEQLSFKLNLPGGETAEAVGHDPAATGKDEPGSIRLLRGSTPTGRISAPHGADADGTPLDTSLSLSGNVVTLHFVHQTKDVHYPLAIDPYVDRFRVDGNGNPDPSGTFVIGPNSAPGAWSSYNAGSGTFRPTPGVPPAGGAVTDFNGSLGLYSPLGYYGGGAFGRWQFTPPRSANIWRVDYLNLGFSQAGPEYPYGYCMRTGIVTSSRPNDWFEHGPRALVTGPGTSVSGKRTTPWFGMSGGDLPGDNSCASQTNNSQTHFAQYSLGPAGTPFNAVIMDMVAAGDGKRSPASSSLQGADIFLDDSQAPAVDPASATTVSNPGPGGWVKSANVSTRVLARDAAIGADENTGGLGMGDTELLVPGASAQRRSGPACDRGRVSRCQLASDVNFTYSTDDADPTTSDNQPIPEGVQTVQAKPYDILGKYALAPVAGSIKVDRSGPTNLALSGFPKDRLWSDGQNVKITVSADDRYSGVKELNLKLDNVKVDGAAGNCPVEQQHCERTFTLGDLGAGAHLLEGSAVDQVGNVSAIPAYQFILVDKTAPTTTTVSASPTSWMSDGSPFTVDIGGSDGSTSNDSGIQTIELKLPGDASPAPVRRACGGVDSTSNPPKCQPTDTARFSSTVNANRFPNEGRVQVTGRTIDAAATPSPWKGADLRIDRTPPSLALGGDLYAGRGTILVKNSYRLTMDALDGSSATAASERSGVRQTSVSTRKAGTDDPFTSRWSSAENACPQGSCGASNVWTFNTGDYQQNTRYTVRVVVSDQLGQKTTKDFDVWVGTPLTDALPIFDPGSGLEDFWDYETVPTGAGSQARVRLVNGNMVWQHTPVFQQGRGLSMFLNLTYNSQEPQLEAALPEDMAGDLIGQYNEVGRGFSLGGPGVTRLNDHLDVTLASLPGDLAKVTLTDADGTAHTFASHDGGETFDQPAGVQLQLRRFSLPGLLPLDPILGIGSLVDPARAYAMTRPDGTTFFFDALGYQTSIRDRNGNEIKFNYEYRSPTRDLCALLTSPLLMPPDKLCIRKVVGIVDPAGRELKITYRQRKLADLVAPVIPPDGIPGGALNNDLESPSYASGPVDAITDQRGRRFSFSYDDAGYLKTFKEADGWTNTAGDSDTRSWGFDYEPAETGKELLKRRAMTSLTDPRGAKTSFTYASDSQDGSTIGDGLITRHRLATIVDRGEQGTSTVSRKFTYGRTCDLATDTAVNTVTDARGKCWTHRTDGRGRPTELTDPLGTKTTVGWDDDNNPNSVTKAAGTSDAATTTMTYNGNGQPTSMTDPRSKTTTLDYFASDGSADNQSPRTTGGTTIDQGKGFVTDIKSIKKPRGNTTSFTYDDQGHGNRKTTTDGEGQTSRAEYDASGQITDEYDQLNNRTQYQQYDANGLPQKVIDARGKIWAYTYDAAGNQLTEADPRADGSCSGKSYTTSSTYDAYDRLLDEVVPKMSSSCAFITRQHRYDANGNAVRDVDGRGNTTTRSFSATDQPTSETMPSVTHANGVLGPDVTKHVFDAEDDVLAEIKPGGNAGGAIADSYSTRYTLDAVGRRGVAIRRARTTTGSVNLITSYAYDRRDNVVGVGDPNHNKVGDPQSLVQTPAGRRFTYQYDLSDNRTAEIEDPAGKAYRTAFEFDDNDNQASVTDPRGTTTSDANDYKTRVTFDGRDQRTHVIDGEGRDTEYRYREDGLVSSIISPKGSASTDVDGDYESKLEYWPTGELKKRTIPYDRDQYGSKSLSVDYAINDVGDVTTITDPRGKTITNTYYDSGELATTSRASWWKMDGETPTERDPAHPEEDTEGATPEDAKSQEGTFGDFGSVKPAESTGLLPKAGSATLGYDDEMKLTSVKDALGNVVQLGRDTQGRVISTTRPLDAGASPVRSLNEKYAYDYDGNLAQKTDATGALTSWSYDQFDRRVQEIRPGSNLGGNEVTTTYYDENDNPYYETSPRGYSALTGYDALDRVTYKRDRNNNLTSWGYDAAGNQTFERSPAGNKAGRPAAERPRYETQRTYNADNELKTVTNGLGYRVVFEYDKNGNQTKVIAPGAASGPDSENSPAPRVTSTSYDGRDLPWAKTTGSTSGGDRERTTVTEYDPNGYLRRVVTPSGVDASSKRSRYTYSGDGQVDTDADAAQNATVYAYSETDPSLRTSTRHPWDGATDPRYREDASYGPTGWVETIDPAHETGVAADPDSKTTYSYFNDGWIKSAKDKYQTITYDYDGRGAQTLWQSSAGPKMTRSYWPSGQLKRRTGTRDQKTRGYDYEYDKDRSLSKMTDDRATGAASDDRTTTYAYDPGGRQTQVDEKSADSADDASHGKDTLLDYDEDDNVVKRQTDGRFDSGGTYQGGKTTTFTFDSIDRERTMVVTKDGDTDRRTSTEWWSSGDRRSRTTIRPNAAKSTTERRYYFSDGLISRMDRRRTDQTGSDFNKNQSYSYDQNGNRTADERGSEEYNARDQLTKRTKKNGTSTAYQLNGVGGIKRTVQQGAGDTSAKAKTTTYNYWPGGERLKDTVYDDGANAAAKTTTKYCYHATVKDADCADAEGTGELRGYSAKNTTSNVTKSSQLYGYDEFGRKVSDKDADDSDKETTYTYDGLDRRDSKKTSDGKKFDLSYIGNSTVLSEEQQSGGEEVRDYDYDSDLQSEGMTRRTSPSITPKYRAYSKDANGSIEGLEDDSGSVPTSERYAYDPYGKAEKADGSDGEAKESEMSADAQANPFRFDGFYADSGAGTGSATYDMQARSYLPQSGRFLSEDRYESATADLGLKSDVLTQDRYAFGSGNPVSNVEFDGHCPDADMCPSRGADGQFKNKEARKYNSGGGGGDPDSNQPVSNDPDATPAQGGLPDQAGPNNTRQVPPRAAAMRPHQGMTQSAVRKRKPPKPQNPDLSNLAHGALALGGGIPGVGAVADGVDAGLYAVEGDKKGAALAITGLGASIIPGADQASSAARLGRLGAKAADDVASAGKVARRRVPREPRGSGEREYGPFHRRAAPQTSKEMQSARNGSLNEVRGRTNRGGSDPSVDAFRGPLPGEMSGYEFFTKVAPRAGSPPTRAQWRRGDPGVTDYGDDTVGIPCRVSKCR